VNWVAEHLHGLPHARLPLGDGGGKIFAFRWVAYRRRSGLTVPSKSAVKLNMPLKVAAKVDRGDRAYYYERENHRHIFVNLR